MSLKISFGVLVVGFAVAGCDTGGSATCLTANCVADASPAVGDATAYLDGGPGLDAGSGTDAGAPGDGASPPDGPVTDAALPTDGSPPPDAIVVIDDCDPDPPIYPGAPEVMDGLDNDCDGFIDELEVCGSGAAYASIGAAITAAPALGVIQLCPGTYNERLVISGKSLWLVSTGSAADTIIDAGGLGSALVVENVSSNGVFLKDLSLRNGQAPGPGGGIRCANSLLSLEAVSVSNSTAVSEGGGLFAQGCSLELVQTSFAQNQAGDRGGALSVRGGSGRLEASTVTANHASEKGGGMSVIDCDFVVRGNSFIGNSAGTQGGALHYRGNALIENNLVRENTSGWTGGGIYLDQLMPTLRNNEVLANTSINDGGGIYLNQSSALLDGNHIADNISKDDGGGVRIFESVARVINNTIERNLSAGDGGGIRVSHNPCEFADNIIVDNEASGKGGGIDMDNDSSWVHGGTISRNTASDGGGVHAWMFPWFGGMIENVVFEGNLGWKGGAIYLRHNFQDIVLRGLTFKDNRAGYGAGIFARTSHFLLSHSTFVGNWVSHEGAALMIGGEGSTYSETVCPPCPPSFVSGSIDFIVAYDNAADEGASVAWINSPDLAVRNSIFFANASPAVVVKLPVEPPLPGPGVPDAGVPAPDAGEPAADSGVPPPPPPSEPPIWHYNDTFPASFIGIADPTGDDGNLSADPLFLNAAGGDFHLAAGSVCIDAGDPTVLDPDNSRADMGVFGGN